MHLTKLCNNVQHCRSHKQQVPDEYNALTDSRLHLQLLAWSAVAAGRSFAAAAGDF
jgi:hypothetical protein